MRIVPGPARLHLPPWVRCAVVLLPLLHTACSFEEGCTLIEAPAPPAQGIHGVLTRTLAVPYEGYAECTAGPIPQGEVCARDITRRFCTRTDSLGGYRFELPTGQFQICAALAGEGCSPPVEVNTSRSRRVDLCGGRWTVDTPCDTESTYDAGREAPPPPPDRPLLQWVIILDTTRDDAPAPGADICEVFATCRGADLTPIRAELQRGAGTFACDEANTCPPDGRIAIDGDRTCDAPTDAVSLGLNGSLTVAFEREVTGCWLEIAELAELDDGVEGYEVFLCNGPPDLPHLSCARGGDPVGSAPDGGSVVVRLPFGGG